MPGCAAFGCSNRSEKEFKLYADAVFPREKQRRHQWTVNVRRKDWVPTGSSYLCEVHFEESQFEGNRADGWRKLKPNAIPTLFNVPNPPHKINPSPRKSVYKQRRGKAPSNLSHGAIQRPTCSRINFENEHPPSASLQRADFVPAVAKPTVNTAGNQNKEGNAPCTSTDLGAITPVINEGLAKCGSKVDHSYSCATKVTHSLGKAANTTSATPNLMEGSTPNLMEGSTPQLHEKYLEALEENKRLRQQLENATQSIKTALQEENEKLRLQLDAAKTSLSSFLNKDQIDSLQRSKRSPWLTESIVKGLKFRSALSVHGYNFLRETGYPLPSYCTLMRRLREFKLTFGIFTDILEPLKFKVDAMLDEEKFCILSYDEMVISEHLDFDKSTGKFYGSATLGEGQSQKIFTVLARGVRSSWKQIIACHVTPRGGIETDVVKDFILECITFVESCGLHVVALSSDMDNRNRNLWTSLGIFVRKDGMRVNSFYFNGHEIFAIPDVCHLLKNLKAATLLQTIHLPTTFVDFHNLQCCEVRGSYVVDLWNHEIDNGNELRKLHHLRRQDIEPTHFDKMNVGAVVRFFSAKTAAGLEIAVKEKILPEEALTTAFFIRLVEEWFGLVSSKVRKCSITTRNCDHKYIFLHSIIDLFQDIVFDKYWKPLNYGVILATLSFCDISSLQKNLTSY